MINLTTNTKSFSVEKGTSGGKSGSRGNSSSTKIIKQIINQGGSGSGGGSGSSSVDVFIGATADNPGRQGLVPQPLAGQDTLFLKGNGFWEKVFQFIREDEEGNIYIDGKATKFGSPLYLKDIFSNQQDLAENLRKIEIHDNVKFDKDSEFAGNVSVGGNSNFSGDVSVGGSSDFLGETRFSNNVIFNRNQPNGSGPNKVTVNADLEVNGKSNFTDDMTATNITVDYLTVTKLAHFFELVIDKIRASQGQIIITDANAKIDYVEKTGGVSRLYWRADSENQSNLSLNEFVEGDQIVCQTFNRGQMQKNDNGSYHGFNVSNKYYWVVCSGVGQGVEKTFPDSEGNPGEQHVYNFVEISDSDTVSPKDGAFLPEIGDEIVQLGNRTDTLRQAAIIISAYNNAYLDKGIKAPAFVQYDGINDFQLETHRLNVISKGLNRFMGSYLTADGKTDIVDKIGDVETTTNNKFSEIQQTIDGITQTVSNNTREIEKTNQTLTDFKSDSSSNFSGIINRMNNIDSSIGGINSSLGNIDSSIGGINGVIDKINSSIGGINSSIGGLKDNLGNLTIQVETNTENISKIDQKADQIQATVTQNKKSIATINSSIGNLTGKVTENTTNISQLTQRADQIQASVTQNSERIEEVSGSVSGDLTGIRNQVTTNTQNIAALTIKADNINSKVESNTTKIEKNGTDIGTANEKLTNMQTTITNNKSEIDQRADEISATVSSHTTQIDDLTGKVTKNTTDISKIDQKADKIQTTVTKIDGDYVTSSQLTQTSTEILAQVSQTYIKINDGKVIINAAVDEKTGQMKDDIDSIKKGNIELNGNTTINGNLTIQNATDGLTLVGDGGTTEIRSKDIGSFFDYIQNPTKYWEMKQTNTGPGMMMYQDGNNYKEMFVNDNNDANQVISIPANTKVTFNDTEAVFVEQSLRNMGFFPMVIRDPNNTNRYMVNTNDNRTTFIDFVVKSFSMIWTFTNKDTGALIETFTDVTHGEFSVTTAVPNCCVSCKVYAKIEKWNKWLTSFSYNGKNYTLSKNSKVDLVDWAVPIVWTHFTLSSQDPTVNNLIGYNGQAYNFGEGNGMFIGKKGLQAKFGDYTFMINPKDITNKTSSGNEVFYAGIWNVNKYKYTTQQGPYIDSETCKSQFLNQGRGFGVKAIRAAGTSGKMVVLPEDDIIIVSDFLPITGNTGKIDVEIVFPPCNDGRFLGHEIKIMHIHAYRSSQSSTCKISTSDNFYPIYNQSGNNFTSYNFGYETRTFIANFLMGCWIML